MSFRLLAATDLSAPSRHAVDRAFRLAADHAWPLHLVHALPPGLLETLQNLLGNDAPTVDAALAADARTQLAMLGSDPRHTRGITAECAVVHGQTIETLAHHAELVAADLMICGARGEGFLRQLALGTTASRLARKCRRPVLVVKQAAHEAYRRALVAIDFSPASLGALTLVRQLVPDAGLVLVHAVEVLFEGKMRHAGVDPAIIQRYRIEAQLQGMQRLRELARRQGLPPDTPLLALHGDAPSLILEQEQELDCDLIAVGKRGTHMIEELLLGSTTQHLLMESQSDVLVAVGNP